MAVKNMAASVLTRLKSQSKEGKHEFFNQKCANVVGTFAVMVAVQESLLKS